MNDAEWRARAERGEWLEETPGGAWLRWVGDWALQVYRFGSSWEWEVRPPRSDPGQHALGSAEDLELARRTADIVCAALQRAELPVLDAREAADLLGLELAP